MITNFYDLLPIYEDNLTLNPYAAKNDKGDYISGYTSIDYLNKTYGGLTYVDDMINKSDDEGYKLFFKYLKQQGILN